MHPIKPWLAGAAWLAVQSVAQAATIDQMYTATFGQYTQSYTPGGAFMVFSPAHHYVLSDGSSWSAGAGWHPDTTAMLESVQVQGAQVVYTFAAPASGLLFQNTDFNAGEHSAQGELGLPARLELVAAIGGTTATLSGYTQVVSNLETWYGQPRFNAYSAAVGQSVYFQQTYTLSDAQFTATLFDGAFTYNEAGVVNFTQLMPVPEPTIALLLALGLAGVALRLRTPA